MPRSKLTVLTQSLLTKLKIFGRDLKCTLCGEPLAVNMKVHFSRGVFKHIPDRVQVNRSHHNKKPFLICETCYEKTFIDRTEVKT